jgi:hypothetical protein
VDLDPDAALAVVQLECPGASGNPQMPVPAPDPSRELTFTDDDQAAAVTFRERLV